MGVIYILPLHDALPIEDDVGFGAGSWAGHWEYPTMAGRVCVAAGPAQPSIRRCFSGSEERFRPPAPTASFYFLHLGGRVPRSEEHTSELHSPCHRVCRP